MQHAELEEHAKQLKFYQKALIFRWGFPGIAIIAFFIGCIVLPVILSLAVFERPGKHPDPHFLDPQKSYAMRTFVWTSCFSVFLTLFAMWVNVYKACEGNSFSKNPEDWNTGKTWSVKSRTVAEDAENARWARIHNNLLENVPITIAMALCMVFCQPSNEAVSCFILPYPFVRLLHMCWYAIAGSHEIRATLFSLGVVCNYGCMIQALVYAWD